jgi:hypothetical protein
MNTISIVFLGVVVLLGVTSVWWWMKAIDRLEKSKRWHVFLNPFWIFSPNLLDEKGNMYRRRLVVSIAAQFLVLFSWWLAVG